jgi:hypothetical protein
MSALSFFSLANWTERAYRKDNDSTDDGSHHDEDDSTEQEAQGGLLLHAEVDGPEQLPES